MAGRRALVFGASQGIGRATAVELADQGHRVTVLARSADKLKVLVDSLPGKGHDFIAVDLADTESWEAQIREKQKVEAYHLLLLNSGGPKGGPISQAQPEEFLTAMTNHLVANSRAVGLVLEGMRASQFGRIVTVTSTSVKIPIPHLGVSNTVRAAVASWGKTLSLEVAPYGVTVNNVMPGFTETPRLHSLITAKAQSTGQSFQDVEQSWKDMVPMKRFADPSETSALISFLFSDKAGYITGQSIAVDGGRLGCL